ncbi:MAG: glycosyl hydrolase, partial [Thermoanaerobaculia bacterium]|nr:glycosyl hydrolase [Thermoanaerobaculia bacterium]
QVPAEKGANRFVWDLRLAPPETFDGLILWNGIERGPRVPPGSYKARLTVGDWSETVAFTVTRDPRSTASDAEIAAQHDFLVGVRDKLSQAHRAIGEMREVRGQLDTLVARAGDGEAAKPLVERAKKLGEATKAIEERLYQTKNKSEQDPLNFPIRLNDKLAGVYQVASYGDNRPTDAAIAVRDELGAKIDAELAALAKLMAEELPAINEAARQAALPFVAPSPAKQ